MMTINPRNINRTACESAVFYWQDSHDAFLTVAKSKPHAERVKDFNRAQACRRNYQQIKGLIELAHCPVIH